MQNNKASLLAITCGIAICFLANSPAMAQQPIGVLGLYDTEGPASIDKRKISKLSCEIRREGPIAQGAGDIGLENPNYFVSLACKASVLSDPEKRKMVNHLMTNATAKAVLEGTLSLMPEIKNSSKLQDRSYILKISHYNNKNTDSREKDLAELDQATISQPDRFIAESFLSVHHALGMPTPDEVVILYYDSPEHGDHFRSNNPDIMKMVGDFNKNHLNEHIYYFAQATR